jgi:hypothetical protein
LALPLRGQAAGSPIAAGGSPSGNRAFLAGRKPEEGFEVKNHPTNENHYTNTIRVVIFIVRVVIFIGWVVLSLQLVDPFSEIEHLLQDGNLRRG